MIASIFDRRDFPTLEQYRYLNQASLGLIGRPAADAVHGFIDDVARHGNCRMSDEHEAAYLGSLRSVGADVNVVCSLRGGRIRVSLAPYNDDTDVDAFVRALD